MNLFKKNNQKNKNQSKTIKRFLQISSNLLRSFLPSLFAILINYILLHYKAKSILTTYVYGISIINLLFVVANWGGKDFITKAIAKEPFAVKELTAKLFGSKLLISFLIIPIIFFLPTNLSVKLFIAVYLLLKICNPVYESLIVLRKKYHLTLLVDSLLYLALLITISIDGNVSNLTIFMVELLVLEAVRNAIYTYIFKSEISITLNIAKCVQVIKSSSIFFYISIAGFLCSKADLYIIGLQLGKHSMSTYFVITNLVAFCYIGYATINGTFVSGILRYNEKTFSKFNQLSLYSGGMFSIFSAILVYVTSNYYYGLSVKFFFIVLVGLNVFGFTRVLIQMYNYTRSEKQYLVIPCLIISGLANVLLSYLLTPFLQQTGAFAANTISVYVSLFLLQIVYKKR